MEIGSGVASVFASWTLVHTVFTLKYARQYYAGMREESPSTRKVT